MLTLVVTLQVAGEGAARTFFNVYMDAGLGVATAQIGLAAALAQLLAAPAALMAPLLMARWGSVRTFTLATLGMAASLLPLIFIPAWGAASLGFIGVTMWAAISRPVISIFNMAIVAPAWRNLTAGSTTMAVGISWAIMGLAGGFIIAKLGYPSLFATGAWRRLPGVLFWGYFRVPGENLWGSKRNDSCGGARQPPATTKPFAPAPPGCSRLRTPRQRTLAPGSTGRTGESRSRRAVRGIIELSE